MTQNSRDKHVCYMSCVSGALCVSVTWARLAMYLHFMKKIAPCLKNTCFFPLFCWTTVSLKASTLKLVHGYTWDHGLSRCEGGQSRVIKARVAEDLNRVT